jgi:hypothetical protein
VPFGKYLNISFAEWLHGFPVGWTDQKKRIAHFKHSENQLLLGCSMFDA